MIKKINLKSALKNALFAGAMLVTAVPADAQQTPSAYCKTLPAATCEVLNVEPVAPQGGGLMFLIKMCLNQQFQTKLLEMNGGSESLSNLAPMTVQNNGGLLATSFLSSFSFATSAPGFSGSTTFGGNPVLNLSGGCF